MVPVEYFWLECEPQKHSWKLQTSPQRLIGMSTATVNTKQAANEDPVILTQPPIPSSFAEIIISHNLNNAHSNEQEKKKREKSVVSLDRVTNHMD